MATVVDAIFVTLGLDTSKYTAQAENAIKTDTRLEKSLDGVEKKGGAVSKNFEGLANAVKGAAKVFASLASATGIIRFLQNVAEETRQANEEMLKLQASLGLTAEKINGMRGAGAALGGTAEGMTNSMKGLNKGMNDFVTKGDTTLLPFMNHLGVSMVDGQGKLRDVDKVMLDLSDSFSKMNSEQAYALGQDMGFDEGTIAALMQGRDAMKEMSDYHAKMYTSSKEELAASRELSKNQAQLSAHWASMKLMIGNAIIPLLVKLTNFAKAFFEFLQDHQKTVKNVFEAMAFVLGAVLIPLFGKALIAALAFIAPFAPFILVVTALAAAFTLLYDDYKVWAEGGQSLFDWGKFAELIDGTKLSVDALTNGFSNLAKKVMAEVIPTLKGYGSIITKIFDGDFKGASLEAAQMTANLGDKILGAFGTSGQEISDKLFGGGSSGSELQSPAVGGGSNNQLLDLIAKGEVGTTGREGYNTMFRGSRVTAKSMFGKDLSQLTIGEVKQLQKASIKEQADRKIPASRRSSAAGRYQFIYTGFDDYIKSAGLSDKDLFSPENQDAMAMAMLRKGKYGLDAVKAGKATTQQFQNNVLAARWASIKNTSGRGQYDNDGINKASHGSTAEIQGAIQQGAAQAQGMVQQSATPRKLYNSKGLQSDMQSRSVDVKMGDLNIYTTASSVSGITSDAMRGVEASLNNLGTSMA